MKFLWIALAAATAFAQTKSLACDSNNHGNRLVSSCEVREQTIAYGGRLTVDGGVNGGVSIKGWDNSSVLVRSKVEAYAADDATAKSLGAQVRVNWSAGQVSATGPEMTHDQSWAAATKSLYLATQISRSRPITEASLSPTCAAASSSTP